MVVHKEKNWFLLLFTWKGSVLRKVMLPLLLITLFSVVVYCFHGKIYDFKIHLNPAIFTLIGLALAIFMGFCNSASYDRFWEGRKLWGALVIDSRSLVRQVLSLVKGLNEAEKKQFISRVAAFCWALNAQLREKNGTEHLERLLTPEDFAFVQQKHFKPIALLDLLANWISQKKDEQKIDSIILAQIDNQLNALSAIVGGCERIANTPLPFPYRLLMHRTVYLYCFWLPFGLVDSTGFMMPVIVLLISYTFIGLDAIIQEITDPFGEEENDLALNSICQTIEFSINEQAGINGFPLEKTTSHVLN